jgi:hypothetical protein
MHNKNNLMGHVNMMLHTAHNLTQEVCCKKGYIPNISHKAHLI